MSINWAEINEKLPSEKTPEQKERRMAMFDMFDPNGNYFLLDKNIFRTNLGFRSFSNTPSTLCFPSTNKLVNLSNIGDGIL